MKKGFTITFDKNRNPKWHFKFIGKRQIISYLDFSSEKGILRCANCKKVLWEDLENGQKLPKKVRNIKQIQLKNAELQTIIYPIKR